MDITNIILDIIENSIEAEAKNVVVSIKEKDGKIVIFVNDDGKGMSFETLQKADLPNFSTKDVNRGMGLFLLRQFVKTNNGKISIDSKEGIGTTLIADFDGYFSKEFLNGLVKNIMPIFTRADEINFIIEIKKQNNYYKFSSKEVKEKLQIRSFKDTDTLVKVQELFRKDIINGGMYEDNR